MVRVAADRDRCVGSGMCLMAVPDVFDQDDDGIVTLLTEAPADEQAGAVRKAVANCPSRALSVGDA
ncbi:ferredoxin [Pseudonocardia sp. GCM10023141]|uniref:ferredoxin n=1 Tax=Pseudonocardia sp. GCM10023141 TaxID=3252653 RepID=UPI00361C643D